MSFDGSGTFLRTYNWVADATSGTKIRADRHDLEMIDYANGLSNTLTKDGQSQPVADIPMAGHRIINLGEPEFATDAATRNYVETFKNFTTGIDVTGHVQFYDGLILRGEIYSGMGSDPGALFFKAYDEDGAEVNTAYLDEFGWNLEAGQTRFMSGDKVRGSMDAALSGATGAVHLRSYTDAGVSDGHAYVTADGVGLPLTGDFHIRSAAKTRANFGWNDVKGAYIRARDAAEAVVQELALRSAGVFQRMGSATAGVASYVFEDAADFGRAKIIAANADAATTMALATYDNAGVQTAKLAVKAEGLFMTATKGVAPGDAAGDLVYTDQRVFDMGWFPKPAGGTGVTNYPVGTDLFFSSNDTSIQNRNQPVTMKGAAGVLRIYQLNGAEPALTGTWVSCGAYSPVANVWIGTARRVA